MSSVIKLTVADLEALPEDGKRYELIEGELHVSTQPHWIHQRVRLRIASALEAWSEATGLGVVNMSPGVILGEEDAVAPDVVWISRARLRALDAETGRLRGAPDLIVEVLSPGPENGRRDKRAKRYLYSRYGVREYWIVDWQSRRVEVYRRRGVALHLVSTLSDEEELASPLLPGFALRVAELFR